MWVLYCLLGLLLLLIVALSVPIGCRIAYDGDLTVRVRVLGIPFTLIPSPEKENTRRTMKKPAEKEKKPSVFQELAQELKQDSLGGTLHFLGEVAALAGKTIGRLLRCVTIQRLELQMRIATEDAATTAQRYGQVCSVLYPSLAIIEHWVRVRHRHLRVEPNFLMEESAVRFDIRLHLSLWRLLGAAVALLWGFLMIKAESNPQNSKEVS